MFRPNADRDAISPVTDSRGRPCDNRICTERQYQRDGYRDGGAESDYCADGTAGNGPVMAAPSDDHRPY